MAISPGYYKENPASNADNTFTTLQGQGLIVDDPAVTLKTYTNTAKDVASDGIASIVIDGSSYAFGSTAVTSAALETAIAAALVSAGYVEFGGKAVTVAGGNDAAVATIVTKATITKMVSVAPADVAFTAA